MSYKLNINLLTKNQRKELAQIQYDKMNMDEKENIEKSSNNCTIFKKGEFKYWVETKWNTNVYVNPTDTVSQIFDIDNEIVKIAVLNFASYKKPGGLFLEGAPAQEEALCHKSYLYNVLVNHSDDYYAPHMKTLNKALYTDELLYSPNIKFFDYYVGDRKLVTNATKMVDVINCAAPNMRTYMRYYGEYEKDDMFAKRILEDRIELVFDAAVYNKVDILVLGAFGCGVFGNNPRLVAEIFRDFIYGEYDGVFKDIYFPIPIGGLFKNFNVFFDTFMTPIRK